MSKLIDRTGRRDDGWVLFTGDASVVKPGTKLLLPLDVYREYRDRWLTHDGKLGVLLAPSDDPSTLANDLGHLSLIAIDFPSFTDGRGYSSARLLRQRYRYAGELRAVGDVLIDQLAYLRRCGFDSFAPAHPLNAADAEAALARYPDVYSPTVDGRVPIWAKRHGLAGN